MYRLSYCLCFFVAPDCKAFRQQSVRRVRPTWPTTTAIRTKPARSGRLETVAARLYLAARVVMDVARGKGLQHLDCTFFTTFVVSYR